MDVFPETKKSHSRRRVDITTTANNSLISYRLTVTLDLLAEELCICSQACIFPMHVEWKFSGFSKFFGRVLPALWLLSEAFHIFCHLADYDCRVPRQITRVVDFWVS